MRSSVARNGYTSFCRQTWLPVVMTSAPPASRRSAIFEVMPAPLAAFSPLTMTKSTACRRGSPGASAAAPPARASRTRHRRRGCSWVQSTRSPAVVSRSHKRRAERACGRSCDTAERDERSGLCPYLVRETTVSREPGPLQAGAERGHRRPGTARTRSTASAWSWATRAPTSRSTAACTLPRARRRRKTPLSSATPSGRPRRARPGRKEPQGGPDSPGARLGRRAPQPRQRGRPGLSRR